MANPTVIEGASLGYQDPSGNFIPVSAAHPLPVTAAGGGSGDVVGPVSATDGAVAVFDGTSGKLLKNGATPNIGAAGGTSLGLSGALTAGGLASFTAVNPTVAFGAGNGAAAGARWNPWTATNYNWQIDNGITSSGTLNIAPSTAVGGNTYTTPEVIIATTGVTLLHNLSGTSLSMSGAGTFGTDVESTTVGSGFIVKSPNGTRYRLGVSDVGVVTATAV